MKFETASLMTVFAGFCFIAYLRQASTDYIGQGQ
jgi:hypothetical protein